MDTVTHATSGALVGAAFATAYPDHAVELTLLGLLAGSLPDLDFLAEFKSKEAAWKLHRILLHGIVPSSLLAVVLVVLAAWVIPLGWALLAAVVYSALALHLFLDVLTSFGTCLFYPFSKYRVTVKSHFIVDPFVLGLCIWGLADSAPIEALVWMGVYVVFSWGLKALSLRFVVKRIPQGVRYSSITLEPALLSPFRWLVILNTDEGYLFARLDFFWLQPWHRVSKGDAQLVPLALQSGLLQAVLEVFEFPVFRQHDIDGKTVFILEDVKWWTERPFRPLAFTARIAKDHAGFYSALTDIRQGGFFVREHPDHPYLRPPERHECQLVRVPSRQSQAGR